MYNELGIKSLIGGNVMGAMAGSIFHQASQTHVFLHMNLPLWIFFVAVIVLSAFGSFASMLTDAMQVDVRHKIANFFMGFGIGLLSAFVILPSLSSNPSVGMMMITALAFSFSGSVLIHNLGRIMRSDEFSDGIHDTANHAGKTIKHRLIAILKAAIGDHTPSKKDEE
ncbi:MAG: hypothetical protein Q4B81_00080 [Moraxella sp.]|nr:hypothetical protein [Moraxella sp.]